MKHLLLTATLGIALVTGTTALADGIPASAEPLVAKLEAEGYALVETKMSWLGRLVVLSRRDGQLREVVLNRTTGAVLSDRLFTTGSDASGTQRPAPATGNDPAPQKDRVGNSSGNGAPHN